MTHWPFVGQATISFCFEMRFPRQTFNAYFHFQSVQDFYVEREQNDQRLEAAINSPETLSQWSMSMFSEDWNASQFWVLASFSGYK